MLLQFLPLNNIKDCTCSSNSQRVASVGAEKLNISISVTVSNLLGAYDCGNREPIAHGFTNSHDIWDDSIVFTCPVCFPQSSKTSLNLISNTHNSFGFELLVQFLIECFGRDDLPSTALHVLTDEGRSIFSNIFFEVFDVVLNGVLGISELSSVEAWGVCNCDTFRFLVILIPLIRTYLNASTCNPVVSSIKTDNSFFLSVDVGHLHCEVVCFGSRVDKSHNAELFGQFLQQFVSRCHQFVIQESRVGQQFLILWVHSHHIIWMAMTDVRYVVDAVEYLASVLLVEILAFGV